VDRRIVFLNAAVVSAAEQPSLLIEKSGANGDATFGETLPGLLDSNREHDRGAIKNPALV
jgi:hypothetical protein